MGAPFFNLLVTLWSPDNPLDVRYNSDAHDDCPSVALYLKKTRVNGKQEHLGLIQKPDAWNKGRAVNPKVPPDFIKANPIKADLANSNLRWAVVSGKAQRHRS